MQYIAEKLLAINEHGKWRPPPAYYEDLQPENVEAVSQRLQEQEEEIFHIARLINCGWFGMGQYHFSRIDDALTGYAQSFSLIIFPPFLVWFDTETIGA